VAEGCALSALSIAFSGLEPASELPSGLGPGLAPEELAIEEGSPGLPAPSLNLFAPDKWRFARSEPEKPGFDTPRPPMAAAEHSAASPSEGRPPAERIDLALQRMVD